MKDTSQNRNVYSRKDVMKILHVTDTTIHNLLFQESDPIPHLVISRKIIIPCSAFWDWLDRQAAIGRNFHK